MKRAVVTELDNVITYQVYRASRLLRFFLQKRLKINKAHLSPEQFFILLRLYMKDGQTQRDLADPILNDHPNITRMLDKLEKIGYVQRKNDAKDRRSFIITLSARGRAICESSLQPIQEERKKILKGITKEEIKLAQNIIKTVEANLMK